MDTRLLGELTPKEFLSKYWQKKPLLIRQAVPGFTGTLSRDQMFDLARSEEVESRLVSQGPEGWAVRHGPQRLNDLRRKAYPWTVLVQGVNLWDAATDALMRQFDFIPQTRLDDLMVSYAIDGGGVGPHFDDYDVFLLQGMGKRRWQISNQEDRTYLEDAPLKVLEHFVPEHDWVLEPGDMLYLPPEWAHNGIAEGECMTYSIGFRTPSANELVGEFFAFLQERVCLDGMYRDPGLKTQRNSAKISADMVDQVQRMIAQAAWGRSDVADFLGHYLSEPKPDIFFEPPEKPVARRSFDRRVARDGIRLDRRSILLWQKGRFYLNGEVQTVDKADREAMRAFAHLRVMPAETAASLSPASRALCYDWYQDGFIHTGP